MLEADAAAVRLRLKLEEEARLANRRGRWRPLSTVLHKNSQATLLLQLFSASKPLFSSLAGDQHQLQTSSGRQGLQKPSLPSLLAARRRMFFGLHLIRLRCHNAGTAFTYLLLLQSKLLNFDSILGPL